MAKKTEKKDGANFLVCRNAKASQRYSVEDKLECGMVLIGSEVKSLRARRADLDGAYASIENGELYLLKMHIAPYDQAGSFGHETKRTRKLLAHAHELEKLDTKLRLRGYTLIPLSVYFKNGRAKVEIGLAKNKDVDDRREDIKKKTEDREAQQAMGRRR